MSVASFSDWLSYEPNFNQHKAQIINKLRWYENETHRLQARIVELESRPTPEQSRETRDAARYQMCEDLCMHFTDTMGDRIGISLPIPDHPPMKSTAEVFRWIIDAAMDRSALGREE